MFRDATRSAAEESFRRQAEDRLQLLENERIACADAERANRLKDDFWQRCPTSCTP